MRTEAIYDAISGFEEAYVSAAENTDAIRLSFRKHRTRQIQMIGTACACAAVMLAAGWIGSQGWFGKRPPAAPGGFVTGENISVSDDLTTLHTAKEQTEARESTSVSDDPITEQTQNRPTTAKEPSTTEPVKETESRNSKTEKNTAQTVPTGARNREGAPPKPTQTDSSPTTDAPTNPKDEAVFYLRYTYFIVDSAYSAYRPGKVVNEEMVGDRLEAAVATGVYVFSDGRTEEDETLRCEIFALTGVAPEVAVCVRFIDKGKGLTTDHYYLMYHPAADTSAIEAYLIPEPSYSGEE